LTRSEIARLLLEVGAVRIRLEPEKWFTWVSGRRSPIYCDNRILISVPEARGRVADALAAAIRRRFPETAVIAATATAGIPHAAWVAERLDLPMVYVRTQAKEHGMARRVEGRPLRGHTVVLIEDLVSLGGSACAAVEALADEGGTVLGVQAIFWYGFAQACERFEQAGVPFEALTDYDALLELIDADEATRRVLLEWRAR